MKKFPKPEKSFLNKSLVSCLMIFCLLVFISGFLAVNFQVYQKRKTISQRYDNLQQDLEGYMLEEEHLQARVSQKNKQTYLEKLAREDFNLKKAGEQVVAFPVLENKQTRETNKLDQDKVFFQRVAEKLLRD